MRRACRSMPPYALCCVDEVESARHTWLAPRGLAEALPKPDKPLSWYPAIPRHNPLVRAMGFSVPFE
jgi:hypothetical protein